MVKYDVCVVRVRMSLVSLGLSIFTISVIQSHLKLLIVPSSGPFTRPHPAVWRMVFGEC